MTTGLLTTTQAAKLSGLSTGTISRCIDSGLLKGWRVPGSAHRRVPKDELARFLAAHGMTEPEKVTGTK